MPTCDEHEIVERLPKGAPDLLPCACNVRFNLPMFMEDERGMEWIECDLCGKRTAYHRTTDSAVAQWTLMAGL